MSEARPDGSEVRPGKGQPEASCSNTSSLLPTLPRVLAGDRSRASAPPSASGEHPNFGDTLPPVLEPCPSAPSLPPHAGSDPQAAVPSPDRITAVEVPVPSWGLPSDGPGPEEDSGASLRSASDLDFDARSRNRTQTRWGYQDPVSLRLGGKYRVIESVGSGGMSEIYRVQHIDLGKEFALKLLQSRLASDSRFLDQFLNEARVMSRLEHSNIVSISDFGVDATHGAFIVMEFLRGETLRARVSRDGPLRPMLLVDVAIQTADALHFMHQQHLIHLDLKSENLFLCHGPDRQPQRPYVKLLDFGLSRLRKQSTGAGAATLGGTPAYMSPEQILKAAPATSMDIYSFGVLLYELATGHFPFEGRMDVVLEAHLCQPPPSPSTRLPAPLPKGIESLILRCLEKEPTNRPATMGHILYELRTMAQMMDLPIRRTNTGRTEVQPLPVPQAATNVCLSCPMPVFWADAQGRLLAANTAFVKFVHAASDGIRGQAVAETRLGIIWPTLNADLAEVARSATILQRILSYVPEGFPPVTVLISLILEAPGDGVLPHLCGMVVPFDSRSLRT